MKNKYKLFGTSLAFAAMSANAAEITWQTPIDMFAGVTTENFVNNNTDLAVDGELVLAFSGEGPGRTNDGTSSVTVNGVEFTQVNAAAINSGAANVPGGVGVFTTFTTENRGFGDGAFNGNRDISDLIAGGLANAPGAAGGVDDVAAAADVTFTNLVVGQEYLLQVFVHNGNGNALNAQSGFSNGLANDLAANPADPLDLTNDPRAVDVGHNDGGPEGDGANGVGQSVLGTFTADATTQTFSVIGTDDTFATFSGVRTQINAVQLRAITEIIPRPPSDDPVWTGLGGSSLDLTTNNFALNAPDAALEEGTLADVATVNGIAIFGDTYSVSGSDIAVATSTLVIPDGASPTASLFSFVNTAAVDYSITSNDAIGVTGTTTDVTITADGSLALLGDHTYGGNTVVGSDATLLLGDATTSATLASAAIVSSGATVYNTSVADVIYPGGIGGGGSFDKVGASMLTIESNSDFSGALSVVEGTLTTDGLLPASTVDVATGATYVFNGNDRVPDITYTGGGTLVKDSVGELSFRAGRFEFSAGALIDVRQGQFVGSAGGAGGSEVWTNNLSSLNVEFGAVFQGAEGNIVIDALTGTGDLSTGFSGVTSRYDSFTLGAANGDGIFSGEIDNGDSSSAAGNLRKIGTGTQTFAGLGLYTGNTIVQDGAFNFTRDSSISFLPQTNGVTNQITGDPDAGSGVNNGPTATGSGTVDLDGEIFIEFEEILATSGNGTEVTVTAGVDPVVGNSWTLVDTTELAAVTYGANFSVTSTRGFFVETAPGVWTLVDATVADDWIFNESTGILSLGEPIIVTGEVVIEDCNFTTAGTFEVVASNLNPTLDYELRRSADLEDGFPTVVATFTGADANTFTDATPPTGAAFYQLFIVE